MELTRPPSATISGRPGDDEIAAYAKPDVDLVAGDDAIAALVAQRRQTVLLFESLDEERVRGLTYAAGKWTLKEVLGHVADDERIYAYRALRFARNDATELPGFEQDEFTRYAEANRRTLDDLLAELATVRAATLSLYEGLGDDTLTRRGVASGNVMSVRAIAYHIAGHELRHMNVIRERYL